MELESMSGKDKDDQTWSVCVTSTSGTGSTFQTWSVVRPDGKVEPVAGPEAASEYLKAEAGALSGFKRDTVPVEPVPRAPRPNLLDDGADL